MSAAAKDPEGSGLDTLSPLNVKGNRGPLHSRTGGVVRTGARAPSWPPPQPSTPHSQAHCPGGGVPGSRHSPPPPAPESYPLLPGPLRPLPETLLSTPQRWEGGVKSLPGPEAAPFLEGPGTSDDLSSCKVLAPAPSDPTCRAPCPLCPDREEPPARALGTSAAPKLPVRSAPGVPAWMRSESRLPPPGQTPRSKVTGCPLGDHGSRGGKFPVPGRRVPPQGAGGTALPAASVLGSHQGRAAARTSIAKRSGGGGVRMVGGRQGGGQ